MKERVGLEERNASHSVRSIYDAATLLWWQSGAHIQAHGAPGLPGPSSDSAGWDEEQAMLEGAILALQEIHRHRYQKNGSGRTRT